MSKTLYKSVSLLIILFFIFPLSAFSGGLEGLSGSSSDYHGRVNSPNQALKQDVSVLRGSTGGNNINYGRPNTNSGGLNSGTGRKNSNNNNNNNNNNNSNSGNWPYNNNGGNWPYNNNKSNNNSMSNSSSSSYTWPGFIQSNSSGWTMQAAPSSTDSYTVTVTGPERVWESLKSNGAVIGYQQNHTPYTFSLSYPVKTWTFTLPPATGTSITLSFFGEKALDVPFSSQTGQTPSKQMSWITKTFPIVQKGQLPAPVVGSANYDAITPPGVVQEDTKNSWTVDNPSNIFLKLDTYVEYDWTFPEPSGPPEKKQGRVKVDSGTTAKVLADNLRANHIFKEAGIYDILLNLKFTEVIQNGDKIEDVPRDYDYSKTVIVVEHIPEYVGNILATITPPPVVLEDIDNPFLFNTMFSFTRILPPNTFNLIDRFEGIEPGTITYSIDWGDGDVSQETDYPGTDKATIGNNPDPTIRYIKIEGITHKYLEPGNYTVKLKINYSEKHYEQYPIISSTGQIIGYDYKILGPYTHIATSSITVWDQTPPVIVGGIFPDMEATSGDPLEIKLEISDNHPTEPIKSAKLHYMVYPSQWKGNDTPEEWASLDAVIESSGNRTWTISGKIDLPADFATKNFPSNPLKEMKTLKYYFEVEDATANLNPGDCDIQDNHDFSGKYGANGQDYGKISVKDNDPPDIVLIVDSPLDQKIFTFEATGGEKDFTADPPVHAQVKKCYSCPGGSACEMVSLTEDPVAGQNPASITPIGFVSEDYTLKEDTRIAIQWKVTDTVDGPLTLHSEKLDITNNNVVFTTSGVKKIDFYSFDNKNPDGTANGRKLEIDFIVQKLLMSRKVIDDK